MTDRTLHWHIPGLLSETGVVDTDVQGDAYRMDKDYRVLDTWLRVKESPLGTGGIGVQIDINDDGVSIFGVNNKPTLPDSTLEQTCNTFSSPYILEGSIVTLDVDQVGDKYCGKDLVVELYLEEKPQ